jgi:methionyl-tRNA formyltransferase
MRVAFAGTPDFADRSLAAILDAGHTVPLVLTQPDRPAGRGLELQVSAVGRTAKAQNLPLYQPLSLKANDALVPILEAAPDVLVVAAYGLILPQALLDVPRCGCVNIHASLLPRWRGAAPIQRAILAGDDLTGITIMQMDAGLDTGAMLTSGSLPIRVEDTAGTLHDKLAQLGAELIIKTLRGLADGTVRAVAQPPNGITYAAKIAKSEARLDWRKGAADLDRAVRAFNPFPGAVTELGGASLKLWRAKPMGDSGEPGTVLSADRRGIVVACGEGSLCITELQRAGSKRLSAQEFLAGTAVPPGARMTVALE